MPGTDLARILLPGMTLHETLSASRWVGEIKYKASAGSEQLVPRTQLFAFDFAMCAPTRSSLPSPVELIDLRGNTRLLRAPNFHSSLAGVGLKSYDWDPEVPTSRGSKVPSAMRIQVQGT
eukprot:164096-Rhodomonas_salina.1